MQPFDIYPYGGRKCIGIVKGSNARQGDGLKLMQMTGMRSCAYCDLDLVSDYRAWLSLVLDHVVPVKVCKTLKIQPEWCWDYGNQVLACSACNGFCNRYKPSFDLTLPNSLDAFWDLRDRIFAERKNLILLRHEEEREFFARRLWESSPNF